MKKSNMPKVLFCLIFLGSFALLANKSSCQIAPAPSPTSVELGSVIEVGGLISYVSGSLHSRRAVILGSDVYGYTAPNLRAIADKVAAAGFYAVVPDFLHGDPYNPQNPEKPLQTWHSLHPPVEEVDDANAVIAALRHKGIRAVGFAGFCWGGKLAVELAKAHHIRAAVLLHPSFVTVDDLKKVKVPLAVLGAERDTNLPVSLLKQFEEVLSSKPEIASKVKIYPGVRHGFALRYDPADNNAAKSADEAHQDMIKWFTKYIKLHKKGF